jgi:tripartite-type tricarboxylate transporter receptor subunit TctC
MAGSSWQTHMKLIRQMTMALGVVLAATTSAKAQDKFPTKPLTMVVPFAAGGATDVVARIMAEKMGQFLNQQVVVENVGGAGGMTGAIRVQRAAPDGYTMIMGTLGSHAQSQLLREKPAYNGATDFAPVALVADVPLVLITRKDLPVIDLKSFIAHVKANQKTMSFASSGAGAPLHIAAVNLNLKIGAPDVAHVAYRGSGPALNDMVAGKVDYMVDVMSTVKGHVEGGTLKGIAVMQAKRSPSLPNVPTAAEQGLAGVEAYTWNAVFMPKDTPADIIKAVNEAVVKSSSDPVVKKKLEDLGYTVAVGEQSTSAYLGKFVGDEITKWAVPIKAAGLKIE